MILIKNRLKLNIKGSNFEMPFLREQFEYVFFERKIYFKNVFFEGASLKLYLREGNFENVFLDVFLEGAILRISFLDSNFDNAFFEKAILKMHFLREQFWKILTLVADLEMLLIEIATDSSKLRFQFCFIQAYRILVLTHLNLQNLNFIRLNFLIHLNLDFSLESSKVTSL